MKGHTWSSLEELHAFLEDGNVIETDEGFRTTQVIDPDTIIEDNNLFYLAIAELLGTRGEISDETRDAIIRLECQKMDRRLVYECGEDDKPTVTISLEKEDDGAIFLGVDVDVDGGFGYGVCELIEPASVEESLAVLQGLHNRQ